MITITNKETMNAVNILGSIMCWEHWDTIQRIAEKEYHVPSGEFAKLLPEYQRFLALIALGHENLGMFSEAVDKLWHSHILHTRLYEAFCQRYIGRLVHHVPNLTKRVTICSNEPCQTTCKTPDPHCDECGSTDDEHRPATFRNAYLAAYNCLPPAIWGLSEADGGTT